MSPKTPLRRRLPPEERDHLRRPFGSSEAERAIYVDFEGNMETPPSFVGILVEDVFEQIVLEIELIPAAATNAKCYRPPTEYSPIASDAAGLQPRLRASTLADTARDLVVRAGREHRLVITWSQREYEVLTSAVPELVRHLGMIMRDGKTSAQKWLRSMHPDVRMQAYPGAGKHRLKAYLSLIGYRLPTYFGERQAAQRISYVREQLLKRNHKFEALTPTAKAKWTKVLDYNWHDCYGLRELMLHVTRDIAALESANAKSARLPEASSR